MTQIKDLTGEQLEQYAREAAKKGITREERREQIINFVYSHLSQSKDRPLSKEAFKKSMLKDF